jgi:G3E family GTPase
LLLSKTELVDAEALTELQERLAAINPRAPQLAVHFGQMPLTEILDVRGFNLNATLELEPGFLAHAHHHHDDRIGSLVFRADRDFDGARLQDFIGSIVRVFGDDLMRYKGVMAVDDLPYRVILQGVHMLMGASPGQPWATQPPEPRMSTLVFIGRDLPREIIATGLQQCLK